MAKCSRCHKRKAKRPCAALGEVLCSLCCGQIREKEIHCPPKCPYLSKHKSYQEKRIIEKKLDSLTQRKIPEEDILKDERMAWLVFHVEMPLREYSEKKPNFSDKDALIALKYAREKIEKNKRVLILPDEKMKPMNEVGEAIYQAVERCRYERRVILSGDSETYGKEEKIKCLDRVILTVKHFAGERLEDRYYLKNLQERFAKIKKISNQQKILTLP